jgi:hypothetical protein
LVEKSSNFSVIGGRYLLEKVDLSIDEEGEYSYLILISYFNFYVKSIEPYDSY